MKWLKTSESVSDSNWKLINIEKLVNFQNSYLPVKWNEEEIQFIIRFYDQVKDILKCKILINYWFNGFVFSPLSDLNKMTHTYAVVILTYSNG